ncbi:ferrous iron transport protein A [candidate division KSB1 bacterium]|nr:ferrous iron transport protein A [candidate division KSB1 bacterium]
MRRHRHNHSQALTLDQIKSGETVWVESIQGGWGCCQRFNQMGIHAGDPITVKRNGVLGGPILIQVHGSEVALGRGMARHITVALQKILNDT